MKRDYLKVLGAVAVSSLIGGISGLPVSAHCHHTTHCHMHSHMHMHSYMPHSCSSFAHHLSTTHFGDNSAVGGSYAGAPMEEQLALVQARIGKLDNDLTESLAKVTQYQDLKFKDPANSQKYDKVIDSERQNIASIEEELSKTLEQQGELKAQINQRVEEHPIENANTNSPSHDNLD